MHVNLNVVASVDPPSAQPATSPTAEPTDPIPPADVKVTGALNPGAVVGIAVGASLCFLATTCGLLLLWRRRNEEQKRESEY